MIDLTSISPAPQPNSLADLNTKSSVFASPEGLLRHILQRPAAIAVNIRYPDKKLVLPSPLADDELDDLISQHLTGQFKPRTCRRKNGTLFEVTDHYSFGAYILQRQPDDTYTVSCLCLDIDGADHAGGRTLEQVLEIAKSICTVLSDNGLNPVLEYSHGGLGFHIWVFFEQPILAGFARAVADLVIHAAGDPANVEVFPKQDSVLLGRLGNPIALPLNGKKVSINGGNIVNLDLTPRPIETIDFADSNAVQKIFDQWKRFQVALERINKATKVSADFDRLLFRDKPNPNNFSDIGLETVCREFGEITDACEEEEDVLKLNCPRHESRSKKSLHVHVVERWWRCCACNDRGAGEGAELSLAKWLLPEVSDEDVSQRLNQMREKVKGAANV